MDYLTTLPGDEKFVGITVFRDRVIVASDRSVYELKDEALYPIPIVMEPPEGEHHA
jgi:hypothetical protein